MPAEVTEQRIETRSVHFNQRRSNVLVSKHTPGSETEHPLYYIVETFTRFLKTQQFYEVSKDILENR